MEKTNGKPLSRITDFLLGFIAPLRISKQLDLIMNAVWLVIAAACFVTGLILGITDHGFIGSEYFAIRFWYTWSLLCGIPFLVRLVKYLVKTIRKAASVGKRITYTDTTVNEVKPLTGIYEVRREQKNFAGALGYIWGFLSFICLFVALAFVGVFALVARFVLTVKEFLRYACDNGKENIA